MNYRTKTRRFLLQATGVGASALLLACGSGPFAGSLAESPDGGDADSGVLACGGEACGLVAMFPDGGADAKADGGADANADSGAERDGGATDSSALGCTEEGGCGTMAVPPDGGTDANADAGADANGDGGADAEVDGGT
jgi:hypothetical protein